MEWKKYNLIDSIEKIKLVDSYLISNDSPNFKFIALDTETNGLHLYKTCIVGFSFAVKEFEGFYLPLLEWVPDKTTTKTKTLQGEKFTIYEKGHFRCIWSGEVYPENITPKEYKCPEFIAPLIKRWFTNVNLILHNAPFDVNHIKICTGVDLTDFVFLDTALLSHVLNENSPNGLKETASEWKQEIGFDPNKLANSEQLELGRSVLINGGIVSSSGKARSVWRAESTIMAKYAASDAYLTYSLFSVGLNKFVKTFGDNGLQWFFEDEVMPLCREVVIPMKQKGVNIDVEHFKKLDGEVSVFLEELEDSIISKISHLLRDFPLGKTSEEAVSHQRLVKKLIELEGLKVPVKIDSNGTSKESLNKSEVKKEYNKNPHWIWGYILGEDELKYSEDKLNRIKNSLYQESTGQRHRFNIGSDAHLRWLFCDKLKFSKTDLPQTDSATKENPIPSVKAEVLEEFMLPKYDWVKGILLFKKLRKLHSSYIKPAIELQIDGKLYMDMKQNGTVSGRFACSGGFNLQTLPNIEAEMESLKVCKKCKSENISIEKVIEIVCNKKCLDCGNFEEGLIRSSVIKKGFVVPNGFKIVNADYASLEPRVFAFISGDEKLKEVYWKGLDLYSKVYCDVFDKEGKYSADPDAPNFLKNLNKTARTDVKPIVLGIPYGANKYQVAALTGKKKEIIVKDTPIQVPDTEYGQWVIDSYLGTYKELNKYMLKCEIDCVSKGYVSTLIGRRRNFKYAPKIVSFLHKKGLDYRDLVECKVSDLKKANISTTSELGNHLNFSQYELENLGKDLGIIYSDIKEKDYWSYIRNLLKADLNNSKNFPIQGLAGHITNKGMLEAARLFRKNNVNAWVFLQVHDEICVYAKVEESQKAAELLKIAMENNIYSSKLDVEMIADPIICDNLMQAK
ncbi:MAG: hypothetical protein MOGMAGMI_00366 [Candidatus Omnitrophica bacterium]|nr:hypothetical protein [Candidatus Omnitrophota bacterium]